MSWGPGNLVVRANYLATVVCGMFLALVVIAFGLVDLFDRSFRDWTTVVTPLLLTILYVLPGARALRRLFKQGTVVPPELVHERPVVASVVTLAGAVGHFFFVILMSAAIDIAARPEWPDDIGGPMAFFFGLAMLSYLIALLCGELALVGDGVSDAMKKGSGTVS